MSEPNVRTQWLRWKLPALAAWAGLLLFLFLSPDARGVPGVVHDWRTGYVVLSVFLLVLSTLSGLLSRYFVVHSLAAVWVVTQSMIYAELFGAAPKTANGLFILAGVPVLVEIGLRVRRNHRARVQFFNEATAAAEWGTRTESLAAIRALGETVGVRP